MMTYTSVGANTDLEITKAVDIQVAKSETETQPHPQRCTMAGVTTTPEWTWRARSPLTNYKTQPIELEITRQCVRKRSDGRSRGAIVKINSFEDGRYMAAGNSPSWWGWYSWPSWWHQLNGVGASRGRLDLARGKASISDIPGITSGARLEMRAHCRPLIKRISPIRD